MKAAWPILLSMLLACGEGRTPPPAQVGEAHAPKDTRLMDENKAFAQREAHDIEAWIARQGVAMSRSGTGVCYKLVRDLPGDTVRPEQFATVNYEVFLLDGTKCYASTPGKPESFKVEHDNVESGLHEGIQHLSPGDSAVIVIPSHRAFGLIGDQDKIPMRSTVVYHIGLVKITRP